MEPIWHIVGASVQGTSHQKNHLPCQDAHGYQVLPGGIALIVLADGAGSANRSDEGAQLVVERTITSVKAALAEEVPQDEAGWRLLLIEVFRQACDALTTLAETEKIASRAFATTLTCAIASNKGLAVGQIGDGVTVAMGDDGELFAATQPQHGEYANETFFLTMDDALQQVEIQFYPQPIQALVGMTDGLIRLAMNISKNEPHPPFFQPLLAFLTYIDDTTQAQEQLASFLASARVCNRTDDDKTLVLAVRLEPEEV